MKKLVLLFLLLMLGQAFAQGAPAEQLEPETAYSLGEYIDDTYQASRTVTGLLLPADGTFYPNGQYARWKDPVCFNVYGLSAGAKYVVERRMREIAAQVGAPVDRRDPCTPNVTIAFTTDTGATLESISQARPWLVPCAGFIRARVKETLPVQAWYSNVMAGFSGGRVFSNPCAEEGDGLFFIGNETASRLNSGFVTQIATVIILVDTNAVMGMPLGTLADHFALLALAEARQTRGCKEVESIANLMARDCDPALAARTITGNDLKLLTSLYGSANDRLQMLDHVRIIASMRRKLQAESEGGQE